MNARFEWVIEVTPRRVVHGKVEHDATTTVTVIAEDEMAARQKADALMNNRPLLNYGHVWIDPRVDVISAEEIRE